MGLFSKFFGKKKAADLPDISNSLPVKKHATVELKASTLLAFDLPAKGVKYKIPGFKSGLYKIPLEAIVKAAAHEHPSGDSLIEIDTGVMYFIDADYEEKFRQLEEKLFDEEGDSYIMVENPENFATKIGVRFDCLTAPGIDSGFDFEGDGVYTLDISKIIKL